MPKISVIMGCYNSGQRVIAAIESIQKQTFSDWEFIICDDSSTDDTYNILLNLSSFDPRVIIIKNNKNLKLGATLNNCLSVSSGEYIARMDDSDFSYPHRFELQNNFLDDNPDYAIVSSAHIIYNESGESVIRKGVEYPCKKSFLWGTPFCHAASFFRRDALLSVNGYRIAKETCRTEDYDLFMRLYANGYKGYNIQEALYRYYLPLDGMKKRRLIKYRINEAIVRYKGFKSLGLLPLGLPYVFKPIVVSLFPHRILQFLHNKGI
ncbi:MAG: glycosyltransferase [Candidatus Margulisbacteria bacterium]|nr:glycosyltransferase [Candidatus Margulisiibacteriota bacterium]